MINSACSYNLSKKTLNIQGVKVLKNKENHVDGHHLLNDLSIKQVIEVFDLMPDTKFWIKDLEGNFVHVNKYFLEHSGIRSLSNIIGYNDNHIAASHIAEQFIVDDKKVIQGHVVNERLEMNSVKNGKLSWFTTSKRALRDQSGKIVGTYGITRHLNKTSEVLSGLNAVQTPVEYIKNNYMNDICIDKLASVAHLSVSALERRFKKYLAKTPKQFLNEIRLENARRLLVETNRSISDIANATGFSEHSYFSKQFKKMFDQLPSQFRESQISAQTLERKIP